MCKEEAVTVRSNCYHCVVRSDRKFDEFPFSLRVSDFALRATQVIRTVEYHFTAACETSLIWFVKQI